MSRVDVEVVPPGADADPAGAQPAIDDAQALFKEARRRRRRRRLAWLGMALVVIAGTVAVLVATGPSGRGTPPPVTATAARAVRSLPSGAVVTLSRAGPLAVSPSGSLYVADPTLHRVLVRQADGQFADVAGNGTAGFAGDGGPATAAEVSSVTDIAFAPGGELYLADGPRVRVVDGRGIIHTVVGTAGTARQVTSGTPALSARLGDVTSIAFSPAGQLYLSTQSQLLRLAADGRLQAIPARFSTKYAHGSLREFGSIAVGAHGDVFASTAFTGWTVYRIDPDGRATELGYARLSGGGPAVVRRAPNGSIEADDGPNLLRVEGNGLQKVLAIDDVPGINTFVFMDYFTFGPDGTLYADNLGPPGFDPFQQIVSAAGGQAESLWTGAKR